MCHIGKVNSVYYQEDYVYKERESLITPMWEVTTVTYTVRSLKARIDQPYGIWKEAGTMENHVLFDELLGLKRHELFWHHRRMRVKFCKPLMKLKKILRKVCLTRA